MQITDDIQWEYFIVLSCWSVYSSILHWLILLWNSVFPFFVYSWLRSILHNNHGWPERSRSLRNLHNVLDFEIVERGYDYVLWDFVIKSPTSILLSHKWSVTAKGHAYLFQSIAAFSYRIEKRSDNVSTCHWWSTVYTTKKLYATKHSMREREDRGSDVHMQQAFCFSAFSLEGDKTENQVLPVFKFAEMVRIFRSETGTHGHRLL